MRITGFRTGNFLSATPNVKRIDGTNAEEFRLATEDLLEDPDKSLVLDLHKVIYISSAGLRSLLLLAKQMNGRGGKLVVHSLAGPVQDVVKVAGFDRIFGVAGNETEARSLAGMP